IAYLRTADAEDVRERLLGLAHQVEPGDTSLDPQADDPRTHEATVGDRRTEHVLSVPPGRVVASVLLSSEVLFLAVRAVIALFLVLVGRAPAVGGFVPIIVLSAGRALLRLSRWWGLTIGLRGTTLTSQRGLTDTRTSSVPLHRVQAVAIEQPWLWRRQ